ncbi:hypothetical protein PF008_g4583 [Phytophthora fragariae]|uniref:Uncharacterized protein n=1 Tax=Phytophthora fragariae TaxID=53985 RepID=A0A6G0SAU5_9STRA|nr:hypothetical protein PF008_g4583 [Phytophthora fragariae]
MTRERLGEWIRERISTSDELLENEGEVDIHTKDAGGRALIMQLLRAYRKVSTNAGDCPPATALDVEHHIDTGNEAPIMLKRRRQAQTEDAIIDYNTEKMLKAGVIEEGNGAWGFPGVSSQEGRRGAILYRLQGAEQDYEERCVPTSAY